MNVATRSLAAAAAVLCLARPGGGEVVESSANGFSVRAVRTVAAPPARVFDTFVRVATWWSSAHTWSGKASNLRLEARAGGCFCETLPGGGGVVHMTVVHVAPGKHLVLSGALGPLQADGVGGSMTVDVEAKGEGTQLTMVYNVGGYAPGGFTQLAPGVDAVLGTQLDRLQRLVETGSPEGKPGH